MWAEANILFLIWVICLRQLLYYYKVFNVTVANSSKWPVEVDAKLSATIRQTWNMEDDWFFFKYANSGQKGSSPSCAIHRDDIGGERMA